MNPPATPTAGNPIPPPIEERVAALEQSIETGREEHRDITDALERLTAKVAQLEVFLANGDGGLTLSIKHRRVKFAGSLSLPWLMGVLGGGSGGSWAIGRLAGVW